MTERVADFRHTFMIYCLQKLEDGSYVALNRSYKPVGMTSSEWVKYEDLPVRFKFKRGLSARQIEALSYKGDPAAERIYFYNDGCVPTASDANWTAYSNRLKRIAAYLIVT